MIRRFAILGLLGSLALAAPHNGLTDEDRAQLYLVGLQEVLKHRFPHAVVYLRAGNGDPPTSVMHRLGGPYVRKYSQLAKLDPGTLTPGQTVFVVSMGNPHPKDGQVCASWGWRVPSEPVRPNRVTACTFGSFTFARSGHGWWVSTTEILGP